MVICSNKRPLLGFGVGAYSDVDAYFKFLHWGWALIRSGRLIGHLRYACEIENIRYIHHRLVQKLMA